MAYDFLIYPSESRPGPVGTALPMAAVLSFGTLLAIAVLPLPIRIAGGVIAAMVIGGVPRLAGRRALGREGWITRLIRDVSGIAVLAPVLLGGVSPTLPLRLRLAAVFAVVFFVSVDGLRTERLSIRLTILFAARGRCDRDRRCGRDRVPTPRTPDCGLRSSSCSGTERAASRAPSGAVRRQRGLIVEYAVFVAAAIAGGIWINVAHF